MLNRVGGKARLPYGMLDMRTRQPRPTLSRGHRRGTSRQGFSLIEMLVVIGLIGLLMTILIPSLRRSMEHTKSTVCMHNLREIGQALGTYSLESDGWLPVAESMPGEVTPYTSPPGWFSLLVPRYMNDTGVLLCPADRARAGLIDRSMESGPPTADFSSYGLNDLIRVSGRSQLDRNAPRVPSNTILAADVGPDLGAGSTNVHRARVAERRRSGRLRWDDDFHPGSAGLVDSWLTDRHLGSLNVLTMDGSVRSVPTAHLMNDRIESYYANCAAGGCPLCREFRIAHYSFASSRVFWWTGSLMRASSAN
jgi:prepilin-type N-terminal cleavage/methylation domain-containing protein